MGGGRSVLGQLMDEVKAGLGQARAGEDVQSEIRSLKEADLREWLPRLTADERPINPYRMIWALNNTLDRGNTIITHDSGNRRDQDLTTFEAIAPGGYVGRGKS